jgi:hypothetical protein
MTTRTGRGAPVRWAVLQRLEHAPASVPTLVAEGWGSKWGVYWALRRLVVLGCVQPSGEAERTGRRGCPSTIWQVVPALFVAVALTALDALVRPGRTW